MSAWLFVLRRARISAVRRSVRPSCPGRVTGEGGGPRSSSRCLPSLHQSHAFITLSPPITRLHHALSTHHTPSSRSLHQSHAFITLSPPITRLHHTLSTIHTPSSRSLLQSHAFITLSPPITRLHHALSTNHTPSSHSLHPSHSLHQSHAFITLSTIHTPSSNSLNQSDSFIMVPNLTNEIPLSQTQTQLGSFKKSNQIPSQHSHIQSHSCEWPRRNQ